jgi:hypothetical protein
VGVGRLLPLFLPPYYMADSFEQKTHAAMFLTAVRVACVCCVNLAIATDAGRLFQGSYEHGQQEVLAHQQLRSPHPSSIRRSPPLAIYLRQMTRLDAASVNLGPPSLVPPLPCLLPSSYRIVLPSVPLLLSERLRSTTLGFVGQLLSGSSISSGWKFLST